MSVTISRDAYEIHFDNVLTLANWIWQPSDYNHGLPRDDVVGKSSFYIGYNVPESIPFSCIHGTNIDWWIFSFYPIYNIDQYVGRLSYRVICHVVLELVPNIMDTLALECPSYELKCIYVFDSWSDPNWNEKWAEIRELFECIASVMASVRLKIGIKLGWKKRR